MTRPPYKDARRVFWIVDNYSAHRGVRATSAQPLLPAHSRACSHSCQLAQPERDLFLDRAAQGANP
jgi:hypothetical protein